jgi:hypothetical protein
VCIAVVFSGDRNADPSAADVNPYAFGDANANPDTNPAGRRLRSVQSA